MFVHRTQAGFARTAIPQRKNTAVSLPHQVASTPSDVYLEYFFSHFLYQNAFTSISPQFANSVITLLHSSSELHNAVEAISALHISQSTSFLQEKDDPAALQAYSRSVRSLQTKLESESTTRDPSVLWATLLLGVFEVSSTPSDQRSRMQNYKHLTGIANARPHRHKLAHPLPPWHKHHASFARPQRPHLP